ncbi:Sel1-like protein [Kalmanozyma brasiliensis GHG001]|uniref:Sel1-like protein n=1 Tax=Kalmanozyma brasiliensis (strain GHG001) TaxID=1365824 RepID=UPI001CE81FB0|nr:Sel1-like protein [Kalmanozyma brasiliensis GHG001]EST08343.2 Sel1-like protein [Kalmanozyma brasiliensis GHG001]
MDRLQPKTYGASTVRSFSAGSYGSSNGSASSSVSMQNTEHTPTTSPSLSDQGTPSSHDVAWTTLPRAHQLRSPDPANGSSSGLSPLELLVKRGKQVQHDLVGPDDNGAHPTSSDRIYERATALSRKISVRRPPIQPSPDPNDFDDAQSIRSVNLLSDAGSSFQRGGRASAPSSNAPSPNPSSFSVQRGYKASYDDTTDTYSPTQPDAGWQRQSSHLLSNAFRGSIASDISFNSISGDEPESSLSRRASIDTVRSSEFGEHGRWGRAWTSRADDEESAYSESAYGDHEDDIEDQEQMATVNGSIDVEPSRGPLSTISGLDTLAKQWKLDQATRHGRAAPKSFDRNISSTSSADPSQTVVRHMASKEKIANLTRSIPPPSTVSGSNHLTPSEIQADYRHSFVPQIETQDYDQQAQFYGRTPLASADRYLGHRSTASTDTITGNSSRGHNESPPTARVYVYPPSPSGSEASRASGRSGLQESLPPRSGQQRYATMPSPSSAYVETMANSPELSGTAESKRTPLAPSNLLSNPRRASAGTASLHKNRPSGHPTGRAPPPPPPPTAPGGENSSPLGYSDPNQFFQGVDRPIFGRKRAEAIARADGRESMVSDLDVETLRLDGSSRRDSSSTIASVMTSRMSIGSVYHDAVTRQSEAVQDRSPNMQQQSAASPRDNGQAFSHPNASQSSFRSLQAQQSVAYSSPSVAALGSGTGRPPMLRSAQSTNALPRGAPAPGSVDMQPTSSAPSFAQGVLSPNPASTKPRTSPAVDTRTGPTSAEDFLSQGITYHEQGDLARSAFYFERSAKVDGGCVVGMCMFGMALREGWGARKDPVKGFTWIQRAAARAGEMMSNTTSPKTDSELKAIKSELKLSVYELGKCFCYGWGVKMDKHMALEYFELAAKLGDADAQAEAGALYAAGKGCKKDLKKAAMYYRMAEEGGYDTVGLSWIHKDKYK